MTNVDEEWGEKCEELFLLNINMYNKTKNGDILTKEKF